VYKKSNGKWFSDGNGSVLNIPSDRGDISKISELKKMAVYYASKAYVTSLSEALTHEVRHTAIKVSALCPGPVQTEFASAASMHSSRLFRLLRPASSEMVARIGYRGMLKGRPVVIDSAFLSAAAFLNRFMPRPAIMAMTAFLNGAAGKKRELEKGHRK
ncbi:MAG: SDR family NAD(P)-dependent oxidoreductase, partial [Proteobacteria bacterium]|nr:SDR family NAD(P)-dependent oxidoreductase [Pseudomonadota bacterium]